MQGIVLAALGTSAVIEFIFGYIFIKIGTYPIVLGPQGDSYEVPPAGPWSTLIGCAILVLAILTVVTSVVAGRNWDDLRTGEYWLVAVPALPAFVVFSACIAAIAVVLLALWVWSAVSTEHVGTIRSDTGRTYEVTRPRKWDP